MPQIAAAMPWPEGYITNIRQAAPLPRLGIEKSCLSHVKWKVCPLADAVAAFVAMHAEVRMRRCISRGKNREAGKEVPG